LISFFGEQGSTVRHDGHGKHIRRLAHLGTRGDGGVNAVGHVEHGHQGAGVLFNQQQQLFDTRQGGAGTDGHDGAVFGNIRTGDGHVLALCNAAWPIGLDGIEHGLGFKRRLVERCVRPLGEEAGGSEQTGDNCRLPQGFATVLHGGVSLTTSNGKSVGPAGQT